MKKITGKIQQMAQRADEIRRVVEGVPPKIAQVKQAIAETTGQVQKLRADIMSSVGVLRAETDAQLVETLQEIDANLDVWKEAGCRLERAELDLGPTRRLIVHLERVEDVGAARLKALLEEHKEQATLRAVLAALIKAEELDDSVELEALRYTRLTVEVGLIPSVRMGWRTEEVTRQAVAPVIAAPVVAASAPVPTFSQSAYFERKVPETVMAAVHPSDVATVPALAVAEKVASAKEPAAAAGGLAGDWRKTALDRFKKMPEPGRRNQTG